MRLVLLGPPGAGKGTQARRIAQRFGLVHLSSGDILRAERAAGTELGRRAGQYMDAGRLVPDELIVAMMGQHMVRADKAGGYVLDGFPRTRAQAEALDRQLSRQGLRLEAVIELKVADEVIQRRLADRRVCPACGRVYHLQNHRPQVPGRCDADGQELVQRDDDRPEVIRQRLAGYHSQTEPLVAYYAERGLLRVVQGDGGIEAVGARIEALCQSLVGSA